MNHYIKHLISLLIIFGLTVHECSIYSQTTSTKYYQFSSVNFRSDINNENSKLYAYNQQVLPENNLHTFLNTYLNLRGIHSKSAQLTLKLQTKIYQKVCLVKKRHAFLSKRIDFENSYLNTYIF